MGSWAISKLLSDTLFEILLEAIIDRMSVLRFVFLCRSEPLSCMVQRNAPILDTVANRLEPESRLRYFDWSRSFEVGEVCVCSVWLSFIFFSSVILILLCVSVLWSGTLM